MFAGGRGEPGEGGAGIVLDGAAQVTLLGSAQPGRRGSSAVPPEYAPAIALHNGGNTLELRSGATINGEVLSTSGALAGGDTLALGGSDQPTFDLTQLGGGAKYRGFQTLRKVGAGTWLLTNTTGFGGKTQVDAGTLRLNGTMQGSAAIATGGVLRGTGRIGALDNAATVQPGDNGPGIFRAASYTQRAAGTLLLRIDASQASRLAVDGPASLGGTLRVDFATAAPPAAGQRYTLLTAASLAGVFSDVQLLWSGTAVPGTVDYGITLANAVTLTIGGSGVANFAITATAMPSGAGSVSCSPNPVAQGGDASCTATANASYVFQAFAGDCTGATCSLTNVQANKAVTALFKAAQTVTFPPQLPASHSFVVGGTFAINPLAVSNTPNSGNPITYSTLTTGICAVSNTLVTMLAPGVCVIAANQVGNADYLPAPQTTAAILLQSAQSVATTTTLTSSQNPSRSGSAVTFTATVTAATGTPTGNVTFSAGGVSFATVTLDAFGRASATTTTLTLGSQMISASYPGDASMQASAASLRQAVESTPVPVWAGKQLALLALLLLATGVAASRRRPPASHR